MYLFFTVILSPSYCAPPVPFHRHCSVCSAGSDEKCLQGEWKNGLLHTTNLFFTFNFHHKETEFCLPTLYFTTMHWCTGILTLIFLETFLLELWKLINKNSYLTAGFFETGAIPTPTKLQNPTICGWRGPFHSNLTFSKGFFSISAFLKFIHAPKTTKKSPFLM